MKKEHRKYCIFFFDDKGNPQPLSFGCGQGKTQYFDVEHRYICENLLKFQHALDLKLSEPINFFCIMSSGLEP